VVAGIEGAQGNNVEGIAIPAVVARNPLDAGALLNGLAQGQENNAGGKNKPSTGDIGGDIANQIAGGGSPGIDQVVSGLKEQGQAGAKNQSTSQESGKTKGENNAGSQGGAQNGVGNGLAIQIEKTTIVEANGQQIQTEVIKEVGKQSAAPAPVEAAPAVPPVEAQPTPPPAPKGEMPPPPPAPMVGMPSPEGKPAPPGPLGEMSPAGPEGRPGSPPAPEGKPAPPPPGPMANMPPPPPEGQPAPPPPPPAPVAEAPAQAKNGTVAVEAAKSTPENRVTERPAENTNANATVCPMY
jgi:hypothetical protein